MLRTRDNIKLIYGESVQVVWLLGPTRALMREGWYENQ